MPASISSEDEFLALIDRFFPRVHPSLILGRGDDCAELVLPGRTAFSTDLFLEDVHFRRGYFLPREIGHKALAVNLSDLAAAGAHPLGFSLGLMAPAELTRVDAAGILEGMSALARRFDLALVGGDLSRASMLGFSLSIWGGPAVPEAPFLHRGPVKPGYVIFYLGELGLARTGLAELEERGRAALEYFPASCAAHLAPEPLVSAAQLLAGIPGVRLMDVSDGLARDLPRMLGVYGADILLPPESLHREVRSHAELHDLDPALSAFLGGEDYALLGACPEDAFQDLCGLAPARRLGVVLQETGIKLNGTSVSSEGFDHFSGYSGKR